jgi:hypothetical protein
MSSTGKMLSFIGVASLAISHASAQTLPPSVAACASEKDSLARLVCFDREVAKYKQPAASVAPAQAAPPAPKPAPPPVAVAQQPAPAAKDDEFGMNPKIAKQREDKSSAKDTGPRELKATVAKVSTRPYGELVLELDNGQVWEQPETKYNFVIKPGQSVTIKPAKLGSFMLTSDDGSVTRIRRVR